MNNNTQLENQAQRGFNVFRQNMPKLCQMLEMSLFLPDENDSEILNFEVDNIPFSITWDVRKAKGIVNVSVVEYQLSTFTTTSGGRYHPPETYDVQIFESQSIADIMKEAILAVTKNSISHALEATMYSDPEEISEEIS